MPHSGAVTSGPRDGEEKPLLARALEEHLRAFPQDPKGLEDYDWTVCKIISPAPRAVTSDGASRPVPWTAA